MGNCLYELPVRFQESTSAACSVNVDASNCNTGSVLDPATYALGSIFSGGSSNAMLTVYVNNYFTFQSLPTSSLF